MSPNLKSRLILLAALAVTLGGGLVAYVAPASTNVNPAPIDLRPTNNATKEFWFSSVSGRAVDAGGAWLDLDGNASALYASDQCGLPACAYPRPL